MKKTVIIFALLSSSAFAQHDIQQSILACKAESDSLKRLVCYDNVAANLSKASTSAVTKAPIKPAIVVEKPPVPVAKAKPVVAQQQSQQVVLKEENQTAEAKFGQEQKHRTDEVDEVRFTIKSASLSLRKKWKFVFENGQRWEQKDTDKFAKFEAGDEVLIKRGVMNAFYLKKLDANRTIRVKRVK